MNDDDKPYLPTGIREHTMAIGHLCIYWAALEDELDSLLEVLIPLESENRVKETVAWSIDFREKIRILGTVGFIRKINDEWYARLEKELNRLDNELRTVRNRYIHDMWLGMTTIVRRTRKPRVVRPQARQLALEIHEDKIIEADDIWQFIIDVRTSQFNLKALELEYRSLMAALRREQLSKSGEQSRGDRSSDHPPKPSAKALRPRRQPSRARDRRPRPSRA
jgi:hypothetical protein